MANSRPPEQRSTHAPAGTPAQPTGNEVFEAQRTGSAQAPFESTDEAVSQLQALATEYYEKLAQTAQDLQVQAREVLAGSQTYVRDHPAPAVGGAFFLGLLLGLLSGRD